MNTFSAEVVDNYKISITSDTSWSCQSIGNFRLSKYEGEGSGFVYIIVPEDLREGSGYVYFTYGDEKCDYPYVQIYSVNECFIETSPKFKICDGVKTVYLYFKEEGELLDMTLDTNYLWSVDSEPDITYFTDVNKLTIVAKENANNISIKINAESVDCENLIIKLVKKS